MACQSNECNNTCQQQRTGGNSFVFIVVLYILLAIIIGSFVY